MKIDHKDLSEPALLFALALKDGKLLTRIRSIDTETKECEQAVDAFTTRIVVCDRIVMRETSPGLNDDTRPKIEELGIEVLSDKEVETLRQATIAEMEKAPPPKEDD